MNTVLVISILGLSILGLSIGVIFSGQPLAGSCGGNPDGCDLCKGDKKKCTESSQTSLTG